MKVKVCGITSYEDASLALDLGVDALGFNFFPRSLRYVDPADARRIIRRLPPLTVTVGLFVNVAVAREVDESARWAGVQVLQLHGDESADYCRALSDWPLIKVLRLGKDPIREDLSEYPARAFLLDTRDDRHYGGTGRTFDWSLAENISSRYPVILAGGLGPENVGAAIRMVKPYGVDVCSGVEESPGRKHPGKLSAFMNEVYDVCRKH